MPTLGASMVTLLTDNWAGAGAPPTFGFLIDHRKELAPTTEQVLVRLPIHEDVTPINDTYSNFKFTMQIRVKSTVSEDRLKILADETIRIINTYAITGITRQFAKRGENTSDRKRQIFSYDVWAILEEHVSAGGTAYSSPGAGDVVFPADVTVTDDLITDNIISANPISIRPSGNIVDYLEIDTVGGHPIITAVGGGVLQIRGDSGSIRLQPSGDYTDSIEFSTTADVPKMAVVGGSNLEIDTPGASVVLSGDLTVSGKVGIGKAPTYAIDIQGVGANDVSLNDERHVDSAYGIAWYMKKARGTVAVPVIVNNNDVLYELIGYGHDGAAFKAATKIEFGVDGTPGSNDMPGKITLFTTPDGDVTPLAVLTLDSSQNATFAGVTTFADESITTTQIADLLMFGSANAAWVPCAFMIENVVGKWKYGAAWSLTNIDGTNAAIAFNVTQPMVKGALKLYIKGVQIIVSDADAAAFIDRVRVTGLTFDSTDTFGDVTTDRTSPEKYTSAFTTQDCSGFDEVHVYVEVDVDAIDELDIRGVEVHCYYAA